MFARITSALRRLTKSSKWLRTNSFICWVVKCVGIEPPGELEFTTEPAIRNHRPAIHAANPVISVTSAESTQARNVQYSSTHKPRAHLQTRGASSKNHRCAPRRTGQTRPPRFDKATSHPLQLLLPQASVSSISHRVRRHKPPGSCSPLWFPSNVSPLLPPIPIAGQGNRFLL